MSRIHEYSRLICKKVGANGIKASRPVDSPLISVQTNRQRVVIVDTEWLTTMDATGLR